MLGLRAADLDGDKHLDLVAAENGGSNISVLLGKGEGTFAAKMDQMVINGLRQMTSGDLNKDGILDLLVSSSTGLQLLLGKGGGVFAAPLTRAGVTNSYAMVITDLNKDGKDDVVATAASTLAITLGTAN